MSILKMRRGYLKGLCLQSQDILAGAAKNDSSLSVRSVTPKSRLCTPCETAFAD
jgi:hypothetical protein